MSNSASPRKLALAPSAVASLLALIGFSFVFVFAMGGASSRTMQSFHGMHHSAYVYQIANGIIPPTNPSSMESPANFYWGWHALLAAGVLTFDVTPFEMSLWSNALGLAGLLCGLWLLLGELLTRPGLRLAASGLPFILLNPIGTLQFFWRLTVVWIPEGVRALMEGRSDIGGYLMSLARYHDSLQLSDHRLVQLLPRASFIDGLAMSDRAGHLLNKFLNFNSFPLALGLFMLGLWGLLEGGVARRWRTMAVFSGAFGMAIVSPIVALAFGVVVAAALLLDGVTWGATRQTDANRRSPIEHLVIPLGAGLGVLIALPMILPIASAYRGEIAVSWQGGLFWSHAVFIGWALVPSAIVYAIASLRFSTLPRSAQISCLGGVIMSIAAVVIRAPVRDPNEYKFVLLTSILATLTLAALVRQMELGIGVSRGGRRAMTLGVATLSVLGVGVIVLIYSVSPWASSEPFEYRGKVTRLAAAGDPRLEELNEAYSWLRRSTSERAFVLELPFSKDDQLLPVIGQRRVVASLASPFTTRVSSHESLVLASQTALSRLASCRFRAYDLKQLFTVEAKWPDRLYALVEVEAGNSEMPCPEIVKANVERVFANSSYVIYRLSRPAN